MNQKFLKSETGAVTVDWVVLTAALVGLGLATMAVVSSGVEDLSGDVEGELESNIISTGFIGSARHYFDTSDPQGCEGGFETASQDYLNALYDRGSLDEVDNAGFMTVGNNIYTGMGAQEPSTIENTMTSLQGVVADAGGFENIPVYSQGLAYIAAHCHGADLGLL